MNRYSRREFAAALAAMGLTPASFVLARQASAAPSQADVFSHGVASGDPLYDRVILWTKLTPKDFAKEVAGRCVIASDPQCTRVIRSSSFTTSVERDFTVKIDATGLKPATTYYYRFEALGASSPIGRTRTLPLGHVDRLRFAVASCSNYPYGYFNAYGRIAERHDLDFVLHLGDYIYEYELGYYSNAALAGVRDVVPASEILTLTDYRLRHALYKSDPDLQEVHRQHPFICVWDDHEFANDAYKEGAENHNPEKGDGDWNLRTRNAIRAFQEYMPIRGRALDDGRVYRSFKFGTLADLIMLDTRFHGRDKQVAVDPGTELRFDDPRIWDPRRTLLGFDQERWLARELNASKQRNTPWRLIGQQMMMAHLSMTKGQTLRNPDQWDGYASARERLFSHLKQQRIDNTVVLSADIHSSWCNDLTEKPWNEGAYNPSSGKSVLAVEFITPAVSSPGPIRDPVEAVRRAKLLPTISPHIKYVDYLQRGYVLMDITRGQAQGEIYHVPTVDQRVSGEILAATFVTEAGRNSLLPATGPTPTRTAPDPAG